MKNRTNNIRSLVSESMASYILLSIPLWHILLCRFNIYLSIGFLFGCMQLLMQLLISIRFRLNAEKADWIIYVTDVGQSLHFSMVFSVSNLHIELIHLLLFCVLHIMADHM